jgi:hypothetical protein
MSPPDMERPPGQGVVRVVARQNADVLRVTQAVKVWRYAVTTRRPTLQRQLVAEWIGRLAA